MFLLAAAALAATQAPPPGVAPDRQARATVRIISGTRLRFAELEKSDPALFRETYVRRPDGSTETAKLIEFE